MDARIAATLLRSFERQGFEIRSDVVGLVNCPVCDRPLAKCQAHGVWRADCMGCDFKAVQYTGHSDVVAEY